VAAIETEGLVKVYRSGGDELTAVGLDLGAERVGPAAGDFSARLFVLRAE
jgi:hypothetical protein